MRLVCFLLHLSSPGSLESHNPNPPDAPPLAGSLPYSVRTFLSRPSPAATARPVLLQGEADYSKRVFNRATKHHKRHRVKDYPKYLNPTRKFLTHSGGNKSASVTDTAA